MLNHIDRYSAKVPTKMQRVIGLQVLKFVKPLSVLGAVVLIGYFTWNLLGVGHSIANGSQIFDKVSGIRAAVPSSASNVQEQSSAAEWISGCSAIPGSRSGWTTDQVSVSFTDFNSRTSVIKMMDNTLERKGWQRHDSSTGPGQGPITHWTLDVKSKHLIQAWAFPVGPGTLHWFFSASWNPPGPQGQGCP
jgi:hypothetical protein